MFFPLLINFYFSFLFWFMEEDLKSPKWLLGLTNTVGEYIVQSKKGKSSRIDLDDEG